MYQIHGKKLQIILLDNRTFRDDIKVNRSLKKDDRFYELTYAPHTEHKDFLGSEQWQWLEKELQKDADIRIIGTGSQFGAEYNGYETWANFPQEQQRFFDLIKKTKADGVLFISGDVHYGEISRRNEPGLYPIYDITSSGLSSVAPYAVPNAYRFEGPVIESHFGMITIEWRKNDPVIKMEIWDKFDNQRVEYAIKNSEIKFARINKKVRKSRKT
jgi:alkaline phosphatase D